MHMDQLQMSAAHQTGSITMLLQATGHDRRLFRLARVMASRSACRRNQLWGCAGTSRAGACLAAVEAWLAVGLAR